MVLSILSIVPSLTLVATSMLISRCNTLFVAPPVSKSNHYIGTGTSLYTIREATFGMGCFWDPSESVQKVNGVLGTVVGYAGGSLGGSKPLQPPTYDDVCYGDAWVESVMVAYDDEVVSYEALVGHFWEVQKPRDERQYQSIIFPSNELQYEAAQRWLSVATEEKRKRKSDGLSVSVVSIEYDSKRIKKKRPSPPSATITKIQSDDDDNDNGDGVLFYRAEEYHQQFWKKWRPRIAVSVFLLSTSVDLSIVHASVQTQYQWKLGTTILIAGGAFYYTVLERILDTSVTQILPGEFAALTVAAEAKKIKANKST